MGYGLFLSIRCRWYNSYTINMTEIDDELARKMKPEPTMWFAIGIFVLIVAGSLVYTRGFHGTLSSLISGKPGSCSVLAEKYCGDGKLVDYPVGQTSLGLNLPKGAYIYAPFSGMFIATGTAESDPNLNTNGEIILMPFGDNKGEVFHFVGEFKPSVASRSSVKAGQKIAVLGGNIIDQPSNSNLILEFYGLSMQGQLSSSTAIIEKYFNVK